MSQLASVEAIFFAALKKATPEERGAYLDDACGTDAELRRCVERMLNAQPNVSSFLEKPAANLAATGDFHSGDAPPLPEGPGSRVGPYKLLQKIGEGGMGVVYMAEQEHPVRRKVALKIIKPGMDSSQVIARFEAERQALAMMDHQNIARVLDAGTTGEPGCVSAGRPYFVMELVHGIPLTRYCDENKLSPRERLELFVPVCQAIQHAHQKGIIHRDIKPSNVLVTLYDGKPVPKVIDFGVAKATEQRLTERTMFTHYGAVVGTLEYMSPEQAEMSAMGVDTRSDVYSLGVLLYELLTGTTPLEKHRLKQAALAEALRLIREEEPPKPSSRLSASGEKLLDISAHRKTEPGKLAKLVRGELDWVVMKCLEKDRTRRYETANGLARDVERYLHDEAVEACPPSTWYRFGKIARRYKRLLGTAVAFVALLLFGAVFLTWQAGRAALAESRAEAEAARLKSEAALSNALFDLIFADMYEASPHRQPDRDLKIRESLLNKATQKLEEKFGRLPLIHAAVHWSLGDRYFALNQPGDAEGHFKKALDLVRRELGPEHLSTLHALERLAMAYQAQRKYEQTELCIVEALQGSPPRRDERHGAAHVSLMKRLVDLYNAWGRPEQAAAWQKKLEAPDGR
jgi:serine/threonine protein kinase